VKSVGNNLILGPTLQQTKWKYQFHLLADAQTINAFALPGGQIFITRGLLSQLTTEGQLAGVLAHEIGHVVARHGAQQLAKQQLTQGLAGAAGVASGDYGTTQMAMMIGQLVNMKYGREDELQSDYLGVKFMADSNYDPRAMIAVMKTLAQTSKGERNVEFFSTHPNPENRISKIKTAIHEVFPDGVPENTLTP
jgi:predicted Zn-dependent protease